MDENNHSDKSDGWVDFPQWWICIGKSQLPTGLPRTVKLACSILFSVKLALPKLTKHLCDIVNANHQKIACTPLHTVFLYKLQMLFFITT